MNKYLVITIEDELEEVELITSRQREEEGYYSSWDDCARRGYKGNYQSMIEIFNSVIKNGAHFDREEVFKTHSGKILRWCECKELIMLEIGYIKG